MNSLNVLLISTYELGRQPFGLASPAAWLRDAGASVTCLDLSQQPLDKEAVRRAALIAFYLPMHTATRLASRAIGRVRALNPAAHLCAYGLYAPLNSEYLRGLGVRSILGGEFEQALAELYTRLAQNGSEAVQASPDILLPRLEFRVPDRSGLPPLRKYAGLMLPNGERRIVGYTEATRGCKHLCRHCPIVPVYEGKFRVVQREIVLEDIRRQVAAGARHITFGDPDFFNGVTHALELVRALHREHPGVSYDVTVKVEHLLQHERYLPVLRDTGCAFVTTAVESIDDRVLRILGKGHTRADFRRVAGLFREIGLVLAPTFIPFTPWTTLEGYTELLNEIEDLGLVENVAPVQLTIRLLITARSRLLELEQVRSLIREFDEAALSYGWRHSDARVDQLQRELETTVQEMTANGFDRGSVFDQVRRMLEHTMGSPERDVPLPPAPDVPARATIPYLTEPWYC